MFSHVLWVQHCAWLSFGSCSVWALISSFILLVAFGAVMTICVIQAVRVRLLTKYMTAQRARQKGVRFFIWLHLLVLWSAGLFFFNVLALGRVKPYIGTGLGLAFLAAPQLISLHVISSLVTQWRVVALPLHASVNQRDRIYYEQFTYLLTVFAWLLFASLLVGLSSDNKKGVAVVVASLGCMVINIATGLFFYTSSKIISAKLSEMPPNTGHRPIPSKPSSRPAESNNNNNNQRLAPSVQSQMTWRIRTTGKTMLQAYLFLGLLDFIAAISVWAEFYQGYSFVNYLLWLLGQAEIAPPG
eukprot:g41561.t1